MILEFALFLLLMAVLIAIMVIPLQAVDLRPKTIWKMAKLTGPRGLPIFITVRIATLRDIDIMPFWINIRRDYPRLAALWIFGIPEIMLFDPDDLEVIMGNAHYIQKGLEYYLLVPWLQEGLLLSNGEKWHDRRKLLTPAFHFKILEDSMQSLNKHAKLLLRNMLKKNGEPFIVEEMIVPCTLDIICETAMGHSLNTQDSDGNNEYMRAVRRACRLIFERCTKLVYGNEWVYALTRDGRDFFRNLNYLHKFTENIIRNRKMNYLSEEQEYFGKKQKAFLDILIETDKKSENKFTDKDIREEVDTFMFEEKAYEELYEIFGDSERAVTNKDLHEMHYLEMIIKESLRLYPSVPFISRSLTQDLVLKDNVVIPEGANIGIWPFLIHRDPRYYQNPEVFDPERFSLENCKKRHPYAYIPFSAGPRNCIGQKFAMMELKVVLSTILRFAKIEKVNEIDDARLIPSTILRSKDPIKIKLITRS